MIVIGEGLLQKLPVVGLNVKLVEGEVVNEILVQFPNPERSQVERI